MSHKRKLSVIEELLVEQPFKTAGIYVGSMIDVELKKVGAQVCCATFQECVEMLVVHGGALDRQTLDRSALREAMMMSALLNNRTAVLGRPIVHMPINTVGNTRFVYIITHKPIRQKLIGAFTDKPLFIGTVLNSADGDFCDQTVCKTRGQCVWETRLLVKARGALAVKPYCLKSRVTSDSHIQQFVAACDNDAAYIYVEDVVEAWAQDGVYRIVPAEI